MSLVRPFIQKLAELDRTGHPVVAVTLVEAAGSTPQDVGSKMLVDANGLVVGTVGGGRLERQAIQRAQKMLSQPDVARPVVLVDWNLQRDVGMTCGGAVKLLLECYNLRRWHILVFGAGHVAQALTRCLLNLDCQITCVDPRSEWLSRLPESPRLTVQCQSDLPLAAERLTDDDFVVCMTMGHGTDAAILRRILERQPRPVFLGVIGSQAKRQALVRELKSAGIADDLAESFECPIGLPLGNNQPEEIAISIAAQLIQRRDEHWEESRR